MQSILVFCKPWKQLRVFCQAKGQVFLEWITFLNDAVFDAMLYHDNDVNSMRVQKVLSTGLLKDGAY